jgi:hypothetical protein
LALTGYKKKRFGSILYFKPLLFVKSFRAGRKNSLDEPTGEARAGFVRNKFTQHARRNFTEEIIS